MNILTLLHLRHVATRYTKTSRCFTLIAVLLLSFAAVQAQNLQLTMSSDFGDYIGSGQNYNLSAPTQLYISAEDYNLDNIVDRVSFIMNFPSDSWSVAVRSSGTGRNLIVGEIYDNAQRYPFESAGHPGLSVSGRGRSCSSLTGNFVVHEAEFTGNSANGFTVVRFSASFEQRCDNYNGFLYGAISYNSAYTGPTTAITGRAVDFVGRPAANVTMAVNGSQALTTTTDANGNYSFPALILNGNYRVAPVAGNYTSNPASRLFKRSSSPQTADFTIVNNHRVTGRITNRFGDTLAGHPVRLSGTSLTLQTTTDSSGNYLFEGVPASDYVTIRPLGQFIRSLPETTTVSMALGDQTADFVSLHILRQRADFNGDRRADFSVWRPENATWYVWQTSSWNYLTLNWGLPDDVVMPEDYDGDGFSDFAVFRGGTWWLTDRFSIVTNVQFGLPGDIPVSGDFDGDRRADIAVFRPSNGAWYIQQSRDGFTAFEFGAATDKPVPADYDGDGKTDPALYRSETGTWLVRRSRLGEASAAFGIATDKPVPGDYDGDGAVDVAVYRDGVWYVLNALGSVSIVHFGLAGDVPVPADYDGDFKTDFAVYRGGTWYLLQSRNGFGVAQFGLPTDTPLPAVLSAF